MEKLTKDARAMGHGKRGRRGKARHSDRGKPEKVPACKPGCVPAHHGSVLLQAPQQFLHWRRQRYFHSAGELCPHLHRQPDGGDQRGPAGGGVHLHRPGVRLLDHLLQPDVLPGDLDFRKGLPHDRPLYGPAPAGAGVRHDAPGAGDRRCCFTATPPPAARTSWP